MNNREKVIKAFRTRIISDSEEFNAVEIPVGEAVQILELLKEQEPLAVSEGKINKCVCGNEINRYWHPEYCGFCGKKLEWY